MGLKCAPATERSSRLISGKDQSYLKGEAHRPEDRGRVLRSEKRGEGRQV